MSLSRTKWRAMIRRNLGPYENHKWISDNTRCGDLRCTQCGYVKYYTTKLYGELASCDLVIAGQVTSS